MSLVNDLLIELNREQVEQTNDRSFFLDGMRPDPERAKTFPRLSTSLALLATLLFIGAGLTFVASDLRPSRSERAAVSAAPRPDFSSSPPITPPLPLEAAAAIVDVSRRADPVPPSSLVALPRTPASRPEPTAASERTTRRIERVTRLSNVTLEPRVRFTRFRLAGDAGLNALIDQSVSGRRLVIHLPKTRFDAPLEGLDLDRTPIAALTTRDSDDGVSFELELDRAVRVRTQERMTADAAMILIDLTPAQTETLSDPIAARSDDGETATASPTASGRESPTRDSVGAQRGIERSASDRLRRDRERARQRADEALAEARLALNEGRLEDVDRLTSQALTHLPNHADAIIARAEYLAKVERRQEALALVHEARRNSRSDPALTMLHARLLEASGRRDDAIRVLDQSGLDVARAPELHAMAAVYLQRDAAHPEAIERFEAIVRRHPGEARWWMGLGISLEAMSRKSEAVDVYRIAMDLGALGRSSREWVSARLALLESEDG